MGRPSQPTASPQLILCLIFSAILVLLLTLILVSPFNHLFPLIPPAYYLTPSSSVSTWSHPDRKHSRIFTENDALFFHDPATNTHESHKTWEEILMPPSGGGILALHPPGSDKEVNKDEDMIISYGISMFHQLHCLIALRGVIFPETSHKQHNSTSKAHSGDHGQDRWHWAHCFDYIAQAIICAADDTIETPKKTTNKYGKPIYHIDGVGATHQCRDSKRLWEVSVKSLETKVDMRAWREEAGVGVREFFGGGYSGGSDDGDDDDGGVPGVYTKGMV
ncbi:uncharacterized protein BDW47DRAFT_129117 [Aspergillus candidus]|uniref:Uncharacterized protein n=1 Tax=Aspergillus candidus TaxID=41067 RepID=A0A2I2F1B4_ASPCN|nr:hypothetical protein BDW47DRAFT_129117 [Aspergillus candidus]PLB34388.1 hypothetical protein BDW47DRAFT_129117 [Aspergillus candidus]